MQMIGRKIGNRRSRLLLSLSSLALLAACGGGEDGTDISYFIDPDPGGSGALGSYYMASITDEWRQAAANIRTNLGRYRLQSGNVALPGGSYFSNPLFSSRDR